MAYFDTSVLVACYVPESGSDKAQRAVSRSRRAAISPLVEVEMASTLSRKVRTGEMSTADAQRVLSQFDLHVSERVFEVLPIGAREFRVARDWLTRFDTPLRSLDALHLAVAFCNGVALLTSDEAMARSAAQLGVRARVM